MEGKAQKKDLGDSNFLAHSLNQIFNICLPSDGAEGANHNESQIDSLTTKPVKKLIKRVQLLKQMVTTDFGLVPDP